MFADTPFSHSFKRHYFFIACLLLAGIFTALFPWRIATGPVTQHLSQQITALTGLTMTKAGRATLSFLPVPRLKIEQVAFFAHGYEVPLFTADQMRGEIRLLPLIAGRLELSDVTLIKPTITVNDEKAFAGWQTIRQRLFDRVAAQLPFSIHRITLIDGAMTLQEINKGVSLGFDHINLVLARPTFGSHLNLAGSVSWNGQAFDISGRLPSAQTLVSNTTHQEADRQITLTMRHRVASLSLNGLLYPAPDMLFNGLIKAQTASVQSSAQWLLGSASWPALPVAGQIDGSLTWTGTTATLSDAHIVYGGNELEGAVRVHTPNVFIQEPEGSLFSLNATLAASTLDLTELVASGHEFWHRLAYSPTLIHDLNSCECDIRVSAARAMIGVYQARDLALSLLSNGGRLDGTLSHTLPEGGRIKARLNLANDPATGEMDSKLNLTGEKISLSPLMMMVFDTQRLSGVAQSFSVSLTGHAARLAEAVLHASGRVTLVLGAGEWNNADLAAGFNDRPTSSLPGPASSPGSPSPTFKHLSFDQGRINFVLQDGLANLNESFLSIGQSNFSLTGNIHIPTQLINIKLFPSLLSDSGSLILNGQDAQGQNLHAQAWQLTGSWKAPLHLEAVTRPSPISAPVDQP